MFSSLAFVCSITSCVIQSNSEKWLTSQLTGLTRGARGHRKTTHEESYPCKYKLMKSALRPQRSPFVSATQASLRVVWREDSAHSTVHLPRQSSPWGAKRRRRCRGALRQIWVVCLACATVSCLILGLPVLGRIDPSLSRAGRGVWKRPVLCTSIW